MKIFLIIRKCRLRHKSWCLEYRSVMQPHNGPPAYIFWPGNQDHLWEITLIILNVISYNFKNVSNNKTLWIYQYIFGILKQFRNVYIYIVSWLLELFCMSCCYHFLINRRRLWMLNKIQIN